MESSGIEKRIELRAPVSRVWRALTDYREFGQWFKVNLDGPFAPGQVSRGNITYPGYEHVTWEARIEKMDPERALFLYVATRPILREDRQASRLHHRPPNPCRISA